MRKKEAIQVVYTAIRTNNKGFSFAEVLLTMSILVMMLPFMGYLAKGTSFSSNYNDLSVQQFFYFLRDDVVRSTDISVASSTIYLKQQDGSIASIEKHGNRVVRKVDRTGFEIYLQDVQDVHFKTIKHGFRVSITMTDGDTYEKDIIIYR
ncbi:hypothetical protein GCM10008983_20750 [Lentibacillus halophilus]|uniref:Competence protein ComGF n=1 Tax=Lentibacillus halophilus TaxID=295065 RepID=A0ABP3J7H8_9BACI